MAPILATRLGAGFYLSASRESFQKETIEESYDKEYGKDTVQMHKDAINEDDVVLLHDDFAGNRWNNGSRLQTGETDEPQESVCKLHHRAERASWKRMCLR